MKIGIFKIVTFTLIFTRCNDNIENKTNVKNKNDADQSPNSKKPTYMNFHVKARPDSISMDPSGTAVIVVDMQNDFGTRGGMFDRAGIDISMIQKAINPTANVLAAARKSGIQVIYLKMAYKEDLSDLGREDAPNRLRHLQNLHVGETITAPDGRKSRILVRETWNTDIVTELRPQSDDIVIYKTRFSGFYQTILDSVLKKLEKKYLVFTGCTTSICVESTVRDAMFRDYLPVVLEDCTAEPIGYGLSRSNHEASLLNFELLGWVSNSEEFIKSVNAQSVLDATGVE